MHFFFRDELGFIERTTFCSSNSASAACAMLLATTRSANTRNDRFQMNLRETSIAMVEGVYCFEFFLFVVFFFRFVGSRASFAFRERRLPSEVIMHRHTDECQNSPTPTGLLAR